MLSCFYQLLNLGQTVAFRLKSLGWAFRLFQPFKVLLLFVCVHVSYAHLAEVKKAAGNHLAPTQFLHYSLVGELGAVWLMPRGHHWVVYLRLWF